MNTRKFSLRSLFGKLLGKRPAAAPEPAAGSRKSTAARERVRSGIEPLEGRIAPAILLNGHMLTYHDADGDLVTVNFSKDIFDFSTVSSGVLNAVFKFTGTGGTHKEATDDGPQQLQLMDLGQVPVKVTNGKTKSLVAGVSFSISVEKNPATGDGLANIGAIKAGGNALGSVSIAGDLGQIDAGVGTVKMAIKSLNVQSIGKFGTTTQRPGATPPTATDPAPSLESNIIGKLGTLTVVEDVQGYIHVVDATRIVNNQAVITGRGSIGKIVVGGSLLGDATVGTASDNTGRIDAAFDIGTVSIGTDFMDGIRGGSGKNSGLLKAGHLIGKVTVAGGIVGGAGDSSGRIYSGGNLDEVRVFGSITGDGPHSGGVFAVGDIASVIVSGRVIGGASSGSGFIEGLKNVGPVFITADVLGGDGAGSGVIASGGALGNVTIGGKLNGGNGANSGAILGGQDPTKSVRSLGDVTLLGALIGSDGDGSGAIRSGGAIGNVKVGTALQTGLAMQGGLGSLSGAIFAGGSIGIIIVTGGIAGGDGTGSASIQAHGLIPAVTIFGDLAGGTGIGSASIVSHELASNAKPVAGRIGGVFMSGKLVGSADRTALIQADGKIGNVSVGAIQGGAGSYSGAIVTGAGFVKPGATTSIRVNGLIEGGAGDHSGYIEIGGRLGSFAAGGLTLASIRVANDLGSLTVNGAVSDSIILARTEAASPGKSAPAIGSVNIGGNWTASVLAAGVVAGNDGLFGTADDRLIAAAHPGKNIAAIAKIAIGGIVEGTSATSDHFGFIAQQIGSFSSNGSALALTKAGGQTFELGTHGDTTVREVVAV